MKYKYFYQQKEKSQRILETMYQLKDKYYETLYERQEELKKDFYLDRKHEYNPNPSWLAVSLIDGVCHNNKPLNIFSINYKRLYYAKVELHNIFEKNDRERRRSFKKEK